MKYLSRFKRKVAVAVMEAEKEMFFDSLPRRIAPATIEEMPTYIRINGTLMARCIVAGIPPTSDLSGYPADMNPRVIDELMNLSSTGYQIAYSFAVIPISNVKSMKMIDIALYANKVSQESFRDKKGLDRNKQPPLKKVLEEEDFVQNYREIFKGKQKMFHTAFIIIFFGKTDTELRAAESHVKVILESNRIYYEAPDYRQLDTFLSAQPFPFSQDFTWCELFSYHTSALLGTRNPNSRTDETGLLFGQDLKTGKDVMIDLTTLSASHMLLVGPTGSGKTFTSMILLMRALTMLRKRVIYITPKADMGTDYRAVCEYFGGAVIDIGNGISNINPLQILYDEQAHGDLIRVFDDHFELLTQFFQVLFEGLSINMTNYISESLIETYKQKGIIRGIPETWTNKTDFPTMLDLREVWIEDSKDTKNVTAKALADKSFLFTTSWSFMNRPTNINLSSDFIVCDISSVPESLKDALNVFTTGLMGLRFRTDTKKGTVLMIDEGAVFLRNQKLSTFLLRALTQGRSFGVSLWLATQQPSDLQKVNLSEEFRTNMPLSIILGNMRSDTVDIVKGFFKLDENATNDLLSAGVGEGLLLAGEEVIPIKFKPSMLEEEIIKRRLNNKIASVHDGIKLIHDGLLNLVTEHGLIMQDWIDGDDSTLSQLGYEPRRVQRAIGSGLIRAWIKTDIMNGEMVMNQSIDHYSTILQIAGWLQQHGIMVDIQHLDGPDIAFKISEQQYYVEFEHGEQSPQILQQKKQDTSNGRLVFVGTSSNIKYLYRNVGETDTYKRGQQLADFLDSIIESNST
uniref:Putative ATPase domain containing protein n=4 Tax=viral metagenome TaxID=1070528 RepID=A0A6M3IVY7_9ZZZZ